MYIAIFLLLVIVLLAILGNSKNKANRWFSILFTTLVVALFTVVLEEQAIPYVRSNKSDGAGLIRILQFTDALFTTIFHYFFPYVLLVYSLYYTKILERLSSKARMITNLLLAVPIILMYIIFPVFSPLFNPDNNPYFPVIAFWAVLYLAAANILLIYSALKEKRPWVKRENLFNLVLIMPGSMFIMFVIYILVAFNIRGGYLYYFPGIIIEFAVFIFLGIRYGILGIRLKVEKYRFDGAMKAMTSGSAILNHAVKNEISKIALCVENIKTAADTFDQHQFRSFVLKRLETVTNSTNHLMEVSSKIQEYMKEIILSEKPNSITMLIDESLENISPFLESKKIAVFKDYSANYRLLSDSTHLKEALHNIFMNAVEAMDSQGRLQISVFDERKALVVKISDSGLGIPENILPLIFNPFFSTKSTKTNFGLGLSYCFNVMLKHEGLLEIENEKNSGTTVYLRFPPHKVL